MESDILSPGMVPSFQNFLLQFLDTKAPVLGKECNTKSQEIGYLFSLYFTKDSATPSFPLLSLVSIFPNTALLHSFY